MTNLMAAGAASAVVSVIPVPVVSACGAERDGLPVPDLVPGLEARAAVVLPGRPELAGPAGRLARGGGHDDQAGAVHAALAVAGPR
jgi:hypothetical protein